MSKLPKLKKKITAFLTKEEGKISKKAIITVGTLIATIAASNLVVAGHANVHSNLYDPNCPGVVAPVDGSAHSNTLNLNYESDTAKGTHNHCIENHDNSHNDVHDNHSSCSHCSGW
jgi:hypothetical protein